MSGILPGHGAVPWLTGFGPAGPWLAGLMVELFQRVARRAGQQLGRPVVSVSNGREITITFGVAGDGAVSGSEDPPLERA